MKMFVSFTGREPYVGGAQDIQVVNHGKAVTITVGMHSVGLDPSSLADLIRALLAVSETVEAQP